MRLLIAGPLNFPRGSAASSRVWAYAKALRENGASAAILCLRPLGLRRLGEAEIPMCARYDGIEYYYSPGVTIRPGLMSRQLYREIRGLVQGVIWTLKRHREAPWDALLFFGSGALHELAFLAVARILRIPYIKEKNEFPVLDRVSLRSRIVAWGHERIMAKLFDGMLLITQALVEYYGPLLSRRAQVLLVPILVDMARFAGVEEPVAGRERYVAYCGDPYGNKDGVPILIDAFGRIAVKHPDVKLYIIGDSHVSGVLERLRTVVKDKSLSDRVLFFGKVDAKEMPKYLCDAETLVLARPRSRQASYGFPTKLGEYLATGNPVVITDVGEITRYVHDGETGYVAQPDSIDAFAEKLDGALSDRERARTIGAAGRRLAQNTFDYRIHGSRIVDFIRRLQSLQ